MYGPYRDFTHYLPIINKYMQRKQELTQQLYTTQVKQYTMKRSKIDMK